MFGPMKSSVNSFARTAPPTVMPTTGLADMSYIVSEVKVI